MLDHYRHKDCKEMFCKYLKKHAMKIINCEKKTTSLTHGENGSYENRKFCYICKKVFTISNKKV